MSTPRSELLTASPIGGLVFIEAVTSPTARYRLQMLGIGDAETLLVQHRGDYGDLIVVVGTRHVHLPEHVARRIRVRRTDAAAAPGIQPSVTDAGARQSSMR